MEYFTADIWQNIISQSTDADSLVNLYTLLSKNLKKELLEIYKKKLSKLLFNLIIISRTKEYYRLSIYIGNNTYFDCIFDNSKIFSEYNDHFLEIGIINENMNNDVYIYNHPNQIISKSQNIKKFFVDDKSESMVIINKNDDVYIFKYCNDKKWQLKRKFNFDGIFDVQFHRFLPYIIIIYKEEILDFCFLHDYEKDIDYNFGHEGLQTKCTFSYDYEYIFYLDNVLELIYMYSLKDVLLGNENFTIFSEIKGFIKKIIDRKNNLYISACNYDSEIIQIIRISKNDFNKKNDVIISGKLEIENMFVSEDETKLIYQELDRIILIEIESREIIKIYATGTCGENEVINNEKISIENFYIKNF